jgi:hypothetical protein
MTQSVYAIKVLTTKKGKPRKTDAWAINEFACFWRVSKPHGTLARIMKAYPLSFETSWPNTNKLVHIEKQLGCKCRVVEIELREKT